MSAYARRLALAAVIAATAGSALAADPKDRSQPLVLKAQGSFFIGGKDTPSDALNTVSPSSGTITTGQMYVGYKIPERAAPPGVSMIMIHGCCLSGKSFEETPDGRMGWDEYFVRSGYPVFIPDQASRARSGFDATILGEIALGLDGKTAADMPILYMESHESTWTGFRFGPSYGVPWPDEQFPVAYADQFYKQEIPDLNGFLGKMFPVRSNPTYRDLSQLAIHTGGAVIVGHSESGFFPENAALVNTADIRGMVSLEPGGSCTTANPESKPLTPQQIAILATIPTLVMFGDHVQGSGFQAAFEDCQNYVRTINQAGGDATFVHLPTIGIHGNSHMMMLDKNNLVVADVILAWMRTHVRAH